MIIVFGFFLVTSAAALLPKLAYANGGTRWRSLKLILFQAPFMNHSQLPRVPLKLVLLFLNLFLFFNLNFLACTIKTEKVTVDTHNIIDSIPKLAENSKTLVFYNRELDLVKQAPDGTFLKKLDTGKNSRAVIGWREIVELRKHELNSYVIFGETNSVIFLINILSTHSKKMVAFFKAFSYYERLSVFHMRPSLDGKRKQFINAR